MDKTLVFWVMFFSMMMVSNEAFSDNISQFREFEKWELEVDQNEDIFEAHLGSEGSVRTLVVVDSLGAVGDGVTDDTQAFLDAWDVACSTQNSVFLVPEGRVYLVKASRFRGPCAPGLILHIAGTIVAPDEPSDWDPKNPRVWLVFSKLNRTILQGGGVINGSGKKWWDSSCKRNKTNRCRGAPTALTIDSSSATRVSDLSIINSSQIHFTVSRSNSIRISDLRVWAPGDSPNTDGIHISNSTNVVVEECQIRAGDDCISIVNGTANIKMKNIDCGPGHGISIGSLGKDNTRAVVTGIVLDTATIRDTTNGVRIKTWQGGSGYVRGVVFRNVHMIDVANPIIIDQFYCDSPVTCQNQTSAVKVSQVVFRNISGTSRTKRAMKFACSDTVPCSSIVLASINLVSKTGVAETFCNCAMGFVTGSVRPSAECLEDSTVLSQCNGKQSNSNKKIPDSSNDLREGEPLDHSEL